MNLKEFAKELNLSISTVSKALRDSHEISVSTKNFVLQKAKEFDYQVNPFASSLRRQKSKTIAVVIPEVVNDFFGPVLNGIESIAQEKGYHVLIYLTHEDVVKEVSITKILQNGRVDGVMMSISEQTESIGHLKELNEKDIPLVFFDRVVDSIDVPKVTTNDYVSGLNATEHLIEMGCKRIGFLAIAPNLTITQKRMKGYLEALKKNEIEVDERLIVTCTGNPIEDYKMVENFIVNEKPDGIFATIEKLAINVYEACAQLNLLIPNDVKIICFSNLKTAEFLNPSLTTITQPAYEIGREAASILFKLIEKRGHRFLLERTVIESSLVIRSSTKN